VAELCFIVRRDQDLTVPNDHATDLAGSWSCLPDSGLFYRERHEHLIFRPSPVARTRANIILSVMNDIWHCRSYTAVRHRRKGTLPVRNLSSPDKPANGNLPEGSRLRSRSKPFRTL
jgi:hypothetical protein